MPHSDHRTHSRSQGTKLGYSRATLACSYCRKRKARCTPSGIDGRCTNCVRRNQPCVVMPVADMLKKGEHGKSTSPQGPANSAHGSASKNEKLRETALDGDLSLGSWDTVTSFETAEVPHGPGIGSSQADVSSDLAYWNATTDFSAPTSSHIAEERVSSPYSDSPQNDWDAYTNLGDITTNPFLTQPQTHDEPSIPDSSQFMPDDTGDFWDTAGGQ